ncbi:MAG: helix-turn-helix domain-containing protein, partial [Bifidobacterium pseudocatenulatum]
AKTRGYNDAKIYDYVVTPKKQSDLSAAMNDPQAGQQQYAPQQPQQSAYGQPTTIGQPAGLTASDRQTISQLAAAGKTAQEIAGLLGKPADQVINALGAGIRQEPEF